MFYKEGEDSSIPTPKPFLPSLYIAMIDNTENLRQIRIGNIYFHFIEQFPQVQRSTQSFRGQEILLGVCGLSYLSESPLIKKREDNKRDGSPVCAMTLPVSILCLTNGQDDHLQH